jgi:hypothetical protein
MLIQLLEQARVQVGLTEVVWWVELVVIKLVQLAKQGHLLHVLEERVELLQTVWVELEEEEVVAGYILYLVHQHSLVM